MDAKQLHIRFDKVDRIIKIYDGIRYLELSNSYNEVYYRINSTIYNAKSEECDDKYSINHNPARISIDSYNSLPIGKILTFHNVIILITSIFNRDKNNYYMFLEKGSYKESNTQYF